MTNRYSYISKRMNTLRGDGDTEIQHVEADGLLIVFLKHLAEQIDDDETKDAIAEITTLYEQVVFVNEDELEESERVSDG